MNAAGLPAMGCTSIAAIKRKIIKLTPIFKHDRVRQTYR